MIYVPRLTFPHEYVPSWRRFALCVAILENRKLYTVSGLGISSIRRWGNTRRLGRFQRSDATRNSRWRQAKIRTADDRTSDLLGARDTDNDRNAYKREPLNIRVRYTTCRAQAVPYWRIALMRSPYKYSACGAHNQNHRSRIVRGLRLKG
jgi:hypothetical protein